MKSNTYMEAKILTAPTYRLHLMLVEGAIRFGRQATDAILRDKSIAAQAALTRMVDIVGELLAGVRKPNSELNKKIADLYVFLFRRVAEARINLDAAALAESLELLEYERQTWQMVCDKMESESPNPAATNVAIPHVARPKMPIAPLNTAASPASTRISFEV